MQSEFRQLLLFLAGGLLLGLSLDWLMSPYGFPGVGAVCGLAIGALLPEPLQKYRERRRLARKVHPFWKPGEPLWAAGEPVLYSCSPLSARLEAVAPAWLWRLGAGSLLLTLGFSAWQSAAPDSLDLRSQLLILGFGLAIIAVPLALATRLQVYPSCLVLRTPYSCTWAPLDQVVWLYRTGIDSSQEGHPEIVVHTEVARVALPWDPELWELLREVCPQALQGYSSLWLSDWAEVTGEEWLARHGPRPPLQDQVDEEWPNARNWS